MAIFHRGDDDRNHEDTKMRRTTNNKHDMTKRKINETKRRLFYCHTTWVKNSDAVAHEIGSVESEDRIEAVNKHAGDEAGIVCRLARCIIFLHKPSPFRVYPGIFRQ